MQVKTWRHGRVRKLSQLHPSYSKSHLGQATPASPGSLVRSTASQPPLSQGERWTAELAGSRSWRDFTCNSNLEIAAISPAKAATQRNSSQYLPGAVVHGYPPACPKDAVQSNRKLRSLSTDHPSRFTWPLNLLSKGRVVSCLLEKEKEVAFYLLK